jgi:hypothetical protein
MSVRWIGGLALAWILCTIVSLIIEGVWFGQSAISQTAEVITGGGVTQANVVLLYPLLDDDVDNVKSITSTEPTDAPVADSYVPGTQTLTITGLAPSKTRTLTIVYVTPSTQHLDIMNELTGISISKVGSFGGIISMAFGFFTHGLPKLMSWDYAFFTGSFSIIRWCMIPLSVVVVWGLIQLFLPMLQGLITRFRGG